MTKRWHAIVAAAAAILFATATTPASAQIQPQRVEAPPGAWSPEGVDISFPETIGRYRRGNVVQYTPRDWGVSYDLVEGGNFVSQATIYVYDPEDELTCQGEFKGAADAILKQRSEAEQIRVGRAASPLGGNPAGAYLGHYRFGLPQMNGDVASRLYLYCPAGSGWRIKVRASWAAGTDHDADWPMILRAIGWPDGFTD